MLFFNYYLVIYEKKNSLYIAAVCTGINPQACCYATNSWNSAGFGTMPPVHSVCWLCKEDELRFLSEILGLSILTFTPKTRTRSFVVINC
jgi:hypothetical protein